MRKLSLDRIKEKFGWSGHNYKVLMSAIIADNAEKIHGSVIWADYHTFDKVAAKISTKERAITLPSLDDILNDTRSVLLRKSAVRGKLMTENLKEKLAQDLRSILEKPEYVRQRGKLSGTLKNQVIEDLQKKMTDTFKNYTKRDKNTGVPKNIKSIVTTELRSVVNQTKDEFNKRILRENPDTSIKKEWIHNGNVWHSKDYTPRRGHEKLHGKKIGYDENFAIKDDQSGQTHHAPYPHYETLPASQVISCNCEVRYTLNRPSRGIHEQTR